MESQKAIDYWQMFTELMQRRIALVRQRDEAEVELAKMKQLIVSVFAMLPEDRQKANQQAMDDMEAESAGLQDAIKLVFSTNEDSWMSVSNVRDRLIETGFDFRRYKANPLASIATTLKRLADADFIEVKTNNGGTSYMRPNLVDMWAGEGKFVNDTEVPTPHNFVPMNTPGTRRAENAMRRMAARKK